LSDLKHGAAWLYSASKATDLEEASCIQCTGTSEIDKLSARLATLQLINIKIRNSIAKVFYSLVVMWLGVRIGYGVTA
jgi:hypothetical protein